MLKKLYKDETARINQEKWKAVEKANLATKEPKKKHEEITLEDLHEWVTGQCKDLTPEQKLTASLAARRVPPAARRVRHSISDCKKYVFYSENRLKVPWRCRPDQLTDDEM